MEEISKTPFCACLKFRGYAFAWFHNSNLAVYIANQLLAVGLISDCSLYHSSTFNGFDVDSLHDQGQWMNIVVRNHEFFVNYHRSIKVSETRMIGRIISESINNFKENETNYY